MALRPVYPVPQEPTAAFGLGSRLFLPSLVEPEPPAAIIGPALASSTRSVNSNFTGVSQQYQRGSFTAAGLRWAFYSTSDSPDGNPVRAEYAWSSDGESWNSPTYVTDLDVLGASGGARYFEVHFDGTYVHYVKGGIGSPVDLTYRRGLPNGDGTISWDSEQAVVSSDDTLLEVSITTDTDGYPFVSWEHYGTGDQVTCPNPMVAWSTTNDGTFTHASGSPYQASAITWDWWTGLQQLDGGSVALLYWHYDSIYCQIWGGSAWGIEEVVLTPGAEWINSSLTNFATAADAGTGQVYFVYADPVVTAPSDILVAVRDRSLGIWATETVGTGQAAITVAAACGSDGLLHLFYQDNTDLLSTAIHHWTRDGAGAWSQLADLDFSAFGRPRAGALQVSQSGSRDELVVVVQTPDDFSLVGDGSELVVAAVVPLGADDGIENTAGAATITFTLVGAAVKTGTAAGALGMAASGSGAVTKTAGSAADLTLGVLADDDVAKQGATAGAQSLTLDDAAAAQKIVDILAEVALEFGLTGEVVAASEDATDGAVDLLLVTEGAVTKDGTTAGAITLTTLLDAVSAKSADAAAALAVAFGLQADATKVASVAGALGLSLGAVGAVLADAEGDVDGVEALALAVAAVVTKDSTVAAELSLALGATGAPAKAGDAAGLLALALGASGTVTVGEDADAPPVKHPVSIIVTAVNTHSVLVTALVRAAALGAFAADVIIESDNASTVEVEGNLGAVDITLNPKTVVVSPNVATLEVG